MTRSASQSSEEKLPSHLKRYVVKQDYERYTPEEQATWRYTLRQLRDFLSTAAHPCYLEGLQKTGISVERIPRISEMDLLLQKFGWGAVPVSGFIPPAAFMEFQSLGILPIACDMRSLDHLLYTPAPDIVHEAAGHAPILIHPEYAEYLKSYAQVAKKAIISKEDFNQYEAIRELSDVKESPSSNQAEIQQAEERLIQVNKTISHISEAALLSRMNWWTAEYGLVGTLKAPKIYGAGLLSSLGESRECLKDHVKKIPLDMSCVEVSYDITEPQPQLFVTSDFSQLQNVLDDLAKRLSYRRGGIFGLKECLKAQSVNSVELDSGLQISGVLEKFSNEQDHVSFLKFSGPCQLSYLDQELEGHGTTYHHQGYSSPLGFIKRFNKDLSHFSNEEMKRAGLVENNQVHLEFQSGIHLSGTLQKILSKEGKNLILTFKNCLVLHGEEKLFDPDWGSFDLACGEQVVSVFGGPADRVNYGVTEDFVANKIPLKSPSEMQKILFHLYDKVLHTRENISSDKVHQLWAQYQSSSQKNWIIGVEIFELAASLKDSLLQDEIKNDLLKYFPARKSDIENGIRLAQTS